MTPYEQGYNDALAKFAESPSYIQQLGQPAYSNWLAQARSELHNSQEARRLAMGDSAYSNWLAQATSELHNRQGSKLRGFGLEATKKIPPLPTSIPKLMGQDLKMQVGRLGSKVRSLLR